MAKLEVHLVTPEREVFVGEATMVVARTVDGDVGVLPGHVPMLVPLAIGVLTIVDERARLEAAIDGGFLHVSGAGGSTRVDILAEHAELAHEIDVEAARRRTDELQRGTDADAETKAELAKATTRLRIGG